MSIVAMKCPACGADIELDDSREFGFCTFCGTKVMQERIIVEHRGTVAVDNSKNIENWYNLARRARDDGDSKKAEEYYNLILNEETDSWEPVFYSSYYHLINSALSNAGENGKLFLKNEITTLNLLKDSCNDKDSLFKILDELSAKVITASYTMNNAVVGWFMNLGMQNHMRYEDKAYIECTIAWDIAYLFGDSIISLFGDEYAEKTAVCCWKSAINSQSASLKHVGNSDPDGKDIKRINEYTNKIKKYVSDYNPPEIKKKKSGCYIATAVYGSYDCPQVWTLRRYRDNKLASTWYGRTFIKTYYAISPTIVKWFGETEWFNKMWRGRLDSMVEKLQNEGYEDTPYYDR